MRTIYVGHGVGFDYEGRLRKALRSVELPPGTRLLFSDPLDLSGERVKEALREGVALFIADLSDPSVRLGMELAWAEASGARTLCMWPSGSEPDERAALACDWRLSYQGEADLAMKAGEQMRCALEGPPKILIDLKLRSGRR